MCRCGGAAATPRSHLPAIVGLNAVRSVAAISETHQINSQNITSGAGEETKSEHETLCVHLEQRDGRDHQHPVLEAYPHRGGTHRSSAKSGGGSLQSAIASLPGDSEGRFYYCHFIWKSAKILCTRPTYKNPNSVQRYKTIPISAKISAENDIPAVCHVGAPRHEHCTPMRRGRRSRHRTERGATAAPSELRASPGPGSPQHPNKLHK